MATIDSRPLLTDSSPTKGETHSYAVLMEEKAKAKYFTEAEKKKFSKITTI